MRLIRLDEVRLGYISSIDVAMPKRRQITMLFSNFAEITCWNLRYKRLLCAACASQYALLKIDGIQARGVIIYIRILQ